MPRVGDTIRTYLYGHLVRARVLAVYASTGTIDVERLSDGRCFRVSGLRLDGRI
jgi:hypothetical protein